VVSYGANSSKSIDRIIVRNGSPAQALNFEGADVTCIYAGHYFLWFRENISTQLIQSGVDSLVVYQNNVKIQVISTANFFTEAPECTDTSIKQNRVDWNGDNDTRADSNFTNGMNNTYGNTAYGNGWGDGSGDADMDGTVEITIKASGRGRGKGNTRGNMTGNTNNDWNNKWDNNYRGNIQNQNQPQQYGYNPQYRQVQPSTK